MKWWSGVMVITPWGRVFRVDHTFVLHQPHGGTPFEGNWVYVCEHETFYYILSSRMKRIWVKLNVLEPNQCATCCGPCGWGIIHKLNTWHNTFVPRLSVPLHLCYIQRGCEQKVSRTFQRSWSLLLRSPQTVRMGHRYLQAVAVITNSHACEKWPFQPLFGSHL